MKVRINPGRAEGCVTAPPSKSYAHRMMICAALAQGHSLIRGVSRSEDVLATLDCIRALGADCTLSDDTVSVTGCAVPHPGSGLFPCRESGSTLRFILPMSLMGGGPAHFTGSPRLMERGVGVYEKVLSEKGITFDKGSDGLTVTGTLSPGEYTLPGDVSSQFISGLLFALPLLDGDSIIRVLPPIESRDYIRITLDVLDDFGITVTETAPYTFLIPGRQAYRGHPVTVEGDWSNAAFLYALNEVGGRVSVSGLSRSSQQGDRICLACFERLREPGAVIDIADCPDLGPVLMAVAAAGQGAVFTGTRRLRIKESDRAQAMADELRPCGIAVDVTENTVTVHPGTLHAPDCLLHGHNDHRIVMALSVLCSQVGGTIDEAEAVKKSYPDFFTVLGKLGLEVSYGD